MQKDVFRYPFPGLVPSASGDEAAIRQRQGAPAVSQPSTATMWSKVAQGLAIPAWSIDPARVPGAVDYPKIKAIQKFDKRRPSTISRSRPSRAARMAEDHADHAGRGAGAKPLAEAVQAVLLDNLNMKVDLSARAARVPRAAWKQDLQFVWSAVSMDYPDPHNEYFRHVLRPEDHGPRQAWVHGRLRQGARDRARHARSKEAPRAYEGRGDHADRRGLRPGGLGGALRLAKPWVKGIEKNKAGEFVIDGTSTSACSSTSTWSRRAIATIRAHLLRLAPSQPAQRTEYASRLPSGAASQLDPFIALAGFLPGL